MISTRPELKSTAILFLVAFVATGLLSACAGPNADRKSDAGNRTPRTDGPLYYDFNDVLLPRELKPNHDDSFIFRTPGFSAGVLNLSGRVEVSSLIDFFESKMPVDGWREISAVKAPRSLLVYGKQTRWCVIIITEGRFSTNVEVWVTPTQEGKQM